MSVDILVCESLFRLIRKFSDTQDTVSQKSVNRTQSVNGTAKVPPMMDKGV